MLVVDLAGRFPKHSPGMSGRRWACICRDLMDAHVRYMRLKIVMGTITTHAGCMFMFFKRVHNTSEPMLWPTSLS